MSGKFPESSVIRAFAEEICRRLTRKVIASLQKMIVSASRQKM